MPESTTRGAGFDAGSAGDADVRRALRALQQQVADTFNRQQMEIDAILEILFDRGAASLGEFKRHLMLLQQNRNRGQKIHDLVSAITPAAAAAVAAPAATDTGTGEGRRYSL